MAPEGGKDTHEGTERAYPFASLTCAADPNCNNAIEVGWGGGMLQPLGPVLSRASHAQDGSIICLLPGTYEVAIRLIRSAHRLTLHPIPARTWLAGV